MTMLGGTHATFMFKQVLSEAPWIDSIVRGEGEEILVNMVKAIDEGRLEHEGRQAAIHGRALPPQAVAGEGLSMRPPPMTASPSS